jgi:hypothetical protein
MRKHIGDLSLFAILLSLLFLPVGSFGLAEIQESKENVLSIVNTRTVTTEEAEESTESTETLKEQEEILEEGISTVN